MSTIFIIRHAEKPEGAIQGVTESGSQDAESLIPQGWQRAGALAVFFGAKDGLPLPDRIYAAAAEKEKLGHKDTAGSKSNRPVETISPLAAKLGMNPTTKYTKGQEGDLVNEIVQLDGTTLVCWQHESIPDIAEGIMGSANGIPNPWPGDRFDVVWCFSGAGKSWTFTQVCQRVLAGDKNHPIT
jgi:broad specificity phosphatase PhoE